MSTTLNLRPYIYILYALTLHLFMIIVLKIMRMPFHGVMQGLRKVLDNGNLNQSHTTTI